MGLRWTEKHYEFITGKKAPPRAKHENKEVIIAGGYQARWKGWVTVGNHRCYFRSLWEYNYACYLEWQKRNGQILSWQHEPYVFSFPRLAYKTAPFGYKPDFYIQKLNGQFEWHEVKGVMNPASKKKIKRFHKHFPEEGPITVIDTVWFKQHRRQLSALVPGWTSLKEMRASGR